HQASFLQHLAADAVAEFLAQLQHSTGNGPLALEGLSGPAHQKNTAAINHDGADSDDGMFGIGAFHCVKKSLGLNPTSFQPLSPSFSWKLIWVLRCSAILVSSTGVAAMSISAMADPWSFSDVTCSTL